MYNNTMQEVLKYSEISLDTWVEMPFKGNYHITFSRGGEMWVKDREIHREDGPAVIWSSGESDYYLHGVKYISKEDFYQELIRQGMISHKEVLLKFL